MAPKLFTQHQMDSGREGVAYYFIKEQDNLKLSTDVILWLSCMSFSEDRGHEKFKTIMQAPGIHQHNQHTALHL